jgi:hypothetical protein
METNRFLSSAGVQEAVFEAIKAKHKNIYAGFPTNSDPLILELADMVLLFSAQLALLCGVPMNSVLAPRAECEAEHHPPTFLS